MNFESSRDGYSLAAERYTSEAVYQQEVEHIFRKQWFAVARFDQCEHAGDYLVVDFFGDEIIVVRDREGQLQAFSNICLHRGCPLLSGRGHLDGRYIQCPYHKWAYELDGQLRAAPLMEQAEGFVATEQRLPVVGVEEWQGWIFVHLDPDAAALSSQLGDLADKLSPFGFSDFRLKSTLHFDSPWNWKIMVENFMESYHHIGAHPESLNPAFPAQGTRGETVQGNYLLLENPSIDEASIAPFWAACILPTNLFALIRNPEAPYALWYQMTIDGPGHFDLKVHVLVPEAMVSDTAAVEAISEATRAIHEEDIPVCEGVWKGVNSRFYKPGRLSHLEACLTQFYRYLDEQVKTS